MTFPRTHYTPRLHRLMAVLGVMVILALNVFAASSAAHEWLCGHLRHSGYVHCDEHHASPASDTHDGKLAEGMAGANGHDHDDSGCIITLFSSGHVLVAIGLPATAFIERVLAIRVATFPPVPVLAVIPHALPPGRAPPRV